jgi:NAD(P)-dependent dehydrogenase (short-subunit alcohol dehydrogenase family)
MTSGGLAGRRVVLTGAGGGLGAALVAAFAEASARVVACDREGPALDASGIVETHRFDLGDAAAVETAAQAILRGGPPDVFVSNAGWTRAETLAQTDDAAMDEEMQVNFAAAATLARRFAPAMRGRDAAMVFVASVNAAAHFGNPAYSAAKAALLAFMRALAVEEGPHGLRANAVVPASIRTSAWDHRLAADPGVIDRVAKLYPLGRLVTPHEVASAVLFLAGPAASGVTGATLAVDAGLTAGNLPFLETIKALS